MLRMGSSKIASTIAGHFSLRVLYDHERQREKEPKTSIVRKISYGKEKCKSCALAGVCDPGWEKKEDKRKCKAVREKALSRGVWIKMKWG